MASMLTATQPGPPKINIIMICNVKSLNESEGYIHVYCILIFLVIDIKLAGSNIQYKPEMLPQQPVLHYLFS